MTTSSSYKSIYTARNSSILNVKNMISTPSEDWKISEKFLLSGGNWNLTFATPVGGALPIPLSS